MVADKQSCLSALAHDKPSCLSLRANKNPLRGSSKKEKKPNHEVVGQQSPESRQRTLGFDPLYPNKLRRGFPIRLESSVDFSLVAGSPVPRKPPARPVGQMNFGFFVGGDKRNAGPPCLPTKDYFSGIFPTRRKEISNPSSWK